MQLRKCLDLSKSNDFCHRLVLFGRDVCKAQRPRCDECELRDECEWVKHPVKKVRRTKKAV